MEKDISHVSGGHERAIWFDVENTPHAWILKEFVESFERLGVRVILTARDFAAAVALCSFLGLKPTVIGRGGHHSSTFAKATGVLKRALALRRFIKRCTPSRMIAVSHGSRSQALAAYTLGMPAFSLDDYEHSFSGFNSFVTNILSPDAIEASQWGRHASKVIPYPGLKEEFYLWNEENLRGDCSALVRDDSVNIVWRPASESAHYHAEESVQREREVIEAFARTRSVHVVLIARSSSQAEAYATQLGGRGISFAVPDAVLNGPSLLLHSDLAIGGGGTMTREACVLGVPSYSYFGGSLGGVDRHLVERGALTLLHSSRDVDAIRFEKRSERTQPLVSKRAFDFVLNFLMERLDAAPL